MTVTEKDKTQTLADCECPPYTGADKAAVFMLSVGPEIAGLLMQHMDRTIVENLTHRIASLGAVPAEDRRRVIAEFYNLAMVDDYSAASGSLAYARSVIENALPKDEAKRVIEQIESQVRRQPFNFLHRAPGETLLSFLEEEHPQTIALVLAHLPSYKAGEVLAGLPPAKQIEVITRVLNMEQADPEVIREVEEGLEKRMSGLLTDDYRKVGGVEAVAEILNQVDRGTEKGILDCIETDDPDLVEQIRRSMFAFEDILLANDKGLQAMLKEISHEDLALALKTASDDLKDKIFKNMSERASTLIKEEMEYMGPVRLSSVESAQQKVIDVVRRLEDAGDLIIEGRSGESQIVD